MFFNKHETNIRRDTVKELIKSLLDAGKLDAETAEKLTTEADDLEGKLKSARDESIDRRKKLKDSESKLEQLTSERESILESLGVDPEEEIDVSLLAEKAKGKTEADKQLELRIKRLEKDLEKTASERDEAVSKNTDTQKQIALSKAMSKHEWIDTELVEGVLSGKIEVNDDGVFMSDGQSLEDGVAQFAADKPHLIKAQGRSGSGYQGKQGGHNQQDYIP